MPVDTPLYPTGLILAGRACLVVGGGDVAAGKVDGLRACGAKVHVVATRVGESVRAREDVTWEERPYRRGEVAGYRLVVAATGSPDVNRAVYEDGEAHGVWVNSADDPANCSFVLPAVLRRGDLTVAVSTAGRSPAVASWLRRRLEAEIGPEYAALLDLVAEAREAVRAAGRSGESVDWQAVLDSDILGLIRAGELDRARERLQSCSS